MNSVVLALALFAGSASADYIKVSTDITTSTCAGNVAMISYEQIGCETNADTSYRLACGNETTAKILSYSTLNCTGSPDGSSDFPVELGCADSGDTYSSLTECVAGPFEAPASSATTYIYNGASECPVPDGADLSIASSYPCGTCIDYGEGNYGTYSCDTSDVTLTYYLDSSCTGDSTYSYSVASVGCTAADNSVTVTDCNTNTIDDATAAAAAAASSSTKKALSTETKAFPAAVKTAHDAAVAKVKSAVAAALA